MKGKDYKESENFEESSGLRWRETAQQSGDLTEADQWPKRLYVV